MNQYSKKLGKGMLVVLFVNIINMAFNVVLNFIQPKYLPVNSYAAIKTFALYISATGIFHLGYEDGMFIKYGGKNVHEINKTQLEKNISTLRIFQFFMSLGILSIGFVIQDCIIIIFSFLLLPYNMTMYFRLFYQAIGEFELYGKIINISTIFIFVGNLFLLFFMKIQTYYSYLFINIIAYTILWIILEIQAKNRYMIHARLFDFSLSELAKSIKSGFFIMLGNFSSVFLTSMDRWCVKFFLSNNAFAEYSFAVSMESFLNVAVTPFTVTLYNYFCREKDILKIKRIHSIILILSTFLVACAFPAKFILQIWLKDYIESVSVMFYLFGSQIFFIIIKSVYVNLYKAQQKQNKYFAKLVLVLVLGLILNGLCYYVFKNKEAMAIATLFTSIIWFILCQIDFKEICFEKRHYLYAIVEVIIFVFLGNRFDAVIGGCLYLIITAVLLITLLKEEASYLLSLLNNIIKKKVKIEE